MLPKMVEGEVRLHHSLSRSYLAGLIPVTVNSVEDVSKISRELCRLEEMPVNEGLAQTTATSIEER